MNLDLKNKTAIVCGATQGIGLGIAQEFAKEGVNLILIARNKEKLIKCINSLESPKKHTFICVDFSKPNELERELGLYFNKQKKAVHILVNNTGGPKSGPIESAPQSEFINAFNMHVLCNQILCSYVVPGMKDLGYGRIINIISTSVKIPITGLGVSNTIRGAVANWSKTMANELGEFQITVNNVLPGYTDTNRLNSLFEKMSSTQNKPIAEVKKNIINNVPLKRLGTVSDVANIVVFLASKKASYISGVNIPVDGGRTGSL
jgi:3-oxoacyl-[acyl-carrier protein] reductase